jgi:hypothetical protein
MPLEVRVRPHIRHTDGKPSAYTRRTPPDRDLLTSRIADLREGLDKRVGVYGAAKGVPISPLVYRTLEDNSRIDFAEHAVFQDTQAWAHASGIISYTEAQIVYQALGEIGNQQNGGWAMGTDLATKLVVQQFIQELLGMKIQMQGGTI